MSVTRREQLQRECDEAVDGDAVGRRDDTLDGDVGGPRACRWPASDVNVGGPSSAVLASSSSTSALDVVDARHCASLQVSSSTCTRSQQ